MVTALAIEIINPSTPVKEDYRGVALYLEENAKAQDVIVISAPFTVYPLEYYYRGDVPLSTLPNWDRYAYGPLPRFDEKALPAQADDATKTHQNAWVMLSYDQGYEKNIKDYFDTHYERLFAKDFSPGLRLYEYKIGYGTPVDQVSTTAQN